MLKQLVVANSKFQYFGPICFFETTLDITSSTSQSNHVYVVIRIKMSENINGLTGNMFCHYGETDDVFLIGGWVEPHETLMASAIRHCRRMVNYRLKSCHRLYLAQLINGLVVHEPVKISIYDMDVLFKDLRWRTRHHIVTHIVYSHC